MKVKEIKVNLYSQPSRFPCAIETHIQYIPFKLLSLVLGIVWFESQSATLKRDFRVSSVRSGRYLPPTSNSSSSHNLCNSSASVALNYRHKVSTQLRVASLTLTCQHSHPGTDSWTVVGIPVCQNV